MHEIPAAPIADVAVAVGIGEAALGFARVDGPAGRQIFVVKRETGVDDGDSRDGVGVSGGVPAGRSGNTVQKRFHGVKMAGRQGQRVIFVLGMRVGGEAGIFDGRRRGGCRGRIGG